MSRSKPQQVLPPIAHAVALGDLGAMVGALLAGLDDEALIAHAGFMRYRVHASASAPAMVVDEACRVLSRSSQFLRRAPPALRAELSSCSLELLALCARLTLQLQRLVDRWRYHGSDAPSVDRDVERATGVVLVVLSYVIEAFQRAHQRDLRVPLIYSLAQRATLLEHARNNRHVPATLAAPSRRAS